MRTELLEDIKNLQLFSKNETIVLALSGGVDSMVLFHILKQLDLTIIIAHINHKVRKESDVEMAALKTLAQNNQIHFRCHEIKTTINSNFQARARKIRYDFFKTVADEFNTKTIVTAHHLDDQIETFLMRLTQNHDLLSLRSMNYKTKYVNYTYIRPFARTKKTILKTYAKTQKISYFEDASNKNDYYLRNHFRHNIIPQLEQINPNLDETIVDKMDDIKTYHDHVENHVNKLKKDYPYRFPINKYLTLSKTTQKFLIKDYMRDYVEYPTLSKGLFDTINKTLSSTTNSTTTLPHGLKLHGEYGEFFVNKITKKTAINLKIDAFGGYDIEGQCKIIISREKKYHKTSKCIELWYNDKVFPIHIRNRAQGDYIEFDYGRKKLKKFFIDEKVSPTKRDCLILIAKGSKILWIPELDVQATSNTNGQKIYIYYKEYPANRVD